MMKTLQISIDRPRLLGRWRKFRRVLSAITIRGLNLDLIAFLLRRKYSLRDIYNLGLIFDSGWYLFMYPDVARASVNPFLHYINVGASEGRDPNPLFNTDWYLSTYPDVAQAGANPLQHYVRFGVAEGRDPNPLFDTDWYLATYPDVEKAGFNPLEHYLEFGASEGRDPNPLFDTDWYLTTYPDVAKSGANPLAHYIQYGASKGYDPNPVFDTDWYCLTYPEAGQAGINPLEHFIVIGDSQGRQINPKLDLEYYCVQSGLKSASPGDAMRHYLDHGRSQGLILSILDVESEKISKLLGDPTLREPVKLTIGIMAPGASERQLTHIVCSAEHAIKRCGAKIRAEILVYQDGEFADEVRLPEGLVFMQSKMNESVVTAHNRMIQVAFNSGTDVYIGAHADGSFHPDCICNLLAMSKANEGRALIEAEQFPEEDPKLFSAADFRTAWVSSVCFLLPRHIWAAINGFDEAMSSYYFDVDISWTAQYYGFETLHCPTALFNHINAGREYDADNQYKMLVSARYLGHKWADRKFQTWAEQQLIEKGLAHTVKDLPLIEDLPTVHHANHSSKFHHLLKFSSVRW